MAIWSQPFWALPSIDFTTTEVVQTQLQHAGFRDFSLSPVPHKDNLPWNVDWIMLEARKHWGTLHGYSKT